MIFAFSRSVIFTVEIFICSFFFFCVISASEKPNQWAFKRARKNRELFINEPPKLLYSVTFNNNKSPKKEAENKPEQEKELGLPPQPKAYIKYPDYDWF